ncbi:DUF4145 domain-containing protein [Vibrio sp. 10N.286.49.B3]|uniref:DUF4145 domain-containing protein n=1 Tax=Vibrio sp. 10N.286.49.B3 TaxID=1880855 RepID=UPI000C828EA8|nr:DUF4145 domain-containing protein [Vibrio sp. 10N.286.49.B3]PMH45440.1 DUF4145 domain-containing protein [Vibrio sp. 10N.286.49.B3]
MSDIDKVVTRTRRLEALLKNQYHAEGKGLHQLITSCEGRLPHDVVGKLRFIATVRNKLLHEDGYKLENRRDFLATCDLCETALTPRSSQFIWRIAILLMMLFTLAAMGFHYIHLDEYWDVWGMISSKFK